jgi:hypothetical protein
MRLPFEKLIETNPRVFLLSSHNLIKDQAFEAIFKLRPQAQVSSQRIKPLAGTGKSAFVGVF